MENELGTKREPEKPTPHLSEIMPKDINILDVTCNSNMLPFIANSPVQNCKKCKLADIPVDNTTVVGSVGRGGVMVAQESIQPLA